MDEIPLLGSRYDQSREVVEETKRLEYSTKLGVDSRGIGVPFSERQKGVIKRDSFHGVGVDAAAACT